MEETKQITLVKQKASKVIEKAEITKITSQSTLEGAKTLLSDITGTQKVLKALRESMTQPINEGLRKIRALFSPVEDNLKETKEQLKEKMSDYNIKIKKEVEEKKAEIVAKVGRGDVDFDKASKQIERADQKVEAIPTRKIREVQVIDEAKIPKKYWALDMVLLRKDAMAGVEIPGVKVEIKEVIVSK